MNNSVVTADFFHTDAVPLRRLHVPFIIKHGIRRMHLTGITPPKEGDLLGD